MLSFVQSWFTTGANPVGVDFGTETLRLAQVDRSSGDHRLIAAASMDVPPDVRSDPAEPQLLCHGVAGTLVAGTSRSSP